jgi:hypothetical protein
MRRTGLLGLALVGLAVGSGAGCRSTCCSSNKCGSYGASRPCETCPPGVPVSNSHPVTVPGDTLPPAGWPEGGYGYPVYPGGTPVPVRPGTAAPANELPYPNIPAPGIPESPAQPIPAIPGSSSGSAAPARTTGDTKQPK